MSWSDSDDDLLLCEVSQQSQSLVKSATSFKPKTSKSKSVAAVGSSVKKQSSWVSSSFDGFDTVGHGIFYSQPIPDTKGKTKKRPREKDQGDSMFNPANRELVENKQKEDSQDLWADKHAPNNIGELAVHKKKILEVQDWLEHSFREKQQQTPILLLTGPSGTGKTACLKVLAKDLKSEIQEWINPTTTVYREGISTWEDTRSFAAVGMTHTESQAKMFQDFILRANKYPTLSIFNQDQLYKKIILVEDIPNTFFRDTSQFHEILRNYEKKGHSPLVFIVSDSVASDSNERLLFPKHIQSDLNISNISFNPVAQTNLTKVLSRIASYEASKQQNKRKFCIPEKSAIEQLAVSSNGDIRGAINALQFACLKDTGFSTLIQSKSKSKSQTTSKSKGKLKEKFSRQTKKKHQSDKSKVDGELAAIGGKDTSLFLFRALGKILYCKRDDPSNYTGKAVLPTHLSNHYRDPLLVNPEDVVEKSHLSSDFFIAYLHQNYPEFYSNIEDVVTASDYLSDADYLTVDWASRTVLKDYASSVAARGLMFSNSSRATHSSSTGSKLGWKPLHKPQWYDVCKKIRINSTSGKAYFAGQCTPIELQTLLIPYLSVINIPIHNTAKADYIKEVGRMSRYVRNTIEKLDEKDVTLLEGVIEQDKALLTDGTQSEDMKTLFTASGAFIDSDEANDRQDITCENPTNQADEEVIIEDFDD